MLPKSCPEVNINNFYFPSQTSLLLARIGSPQEGLICLKVKTALPLYVNKALHLSEALTDYLSAPPVDVPTGQAEQVLVALFTNADSFLYAVWTLSHTAAQGGG